MTRDIIDINDFTILVETADSTETTVDSCRFEESLIAVAFYGSGDVHLDVRYGDQHEEYSHTKGLTLSFFADDQVEFVHTVSAARPLRCIVVATSIRHLNDLPNQEGELFSDLLAELTQPRDHYVEGPSFLMTPQMQAIIDSVFESQYSGKAKMMFFRSQMTSLLAHFFGQLSIMPISGMPVGEREKLEEARRILISDLENPPSLTELSKKIGLNTYKLKKTFKEVFGVPVFKYLQNERLTEAHKLIRDDKMNVQEAAWQVGYDSLSSFSNAFAKKFGYRPSEIRG